MASRLDEKRRRALDAANRSANGHPTAAADAAAREKPKPPAAELLIEIGMECQLWHDASQVGYANVGRESHPIRSKRFKHYLVSEFRRRHDRRVANADAIGNALTAIEAAAVHDGPEHPVFVRVAGHDGRVYIHLADDASSIIEIDRDGWRLCDHPPVRFRKSSGMQPLPMPERGGRIDDLKGFLNVHGPAAFSLVLAWLVAALRPHGPYPLLVLTGEQGSAKSTTARVLRRLVDPSAAPLRCEPKEARDLMIMARHSWALAFDNISYLYPWLSDALCRLATGGGFGTRQLYTDDEEIIFDSMRPVILNGIEAFVTRPDLAERSLLLSLPSIPEERRQPESKLWASFDRAHPRLLGSLLDLVAAGLRTLASVHLDKLPRMADFATWAVACEKGAGDEPRFLDAYTENQRGANAQALDSSSVPPALVAMMEGKDMWTGTATELSAALTVPMPTPKDWPRSPNALSNKLRRLAPSLRRAYGLHLEFDVRAPERNRAKLITITRELDNERETSSGSSASSATDESPSKSQFKRGRSPVAADGPADDHRTVPILSEKARNPSTSDGADDADDVSRSLSGCPAHVRLLTGPATETELARHYESAGLTVADLDRDLHLIGARDSSDPDGTVIWRW